jgi:hypothetical protein
MGATASYWVTVSNQAAFPGGGTGPLVDLVAPGGGLRLAGIIFNSAGNFVATSAMDPSGSPSQSTTPVVPGFYPFEPTSISQTTTALPLILLYERASQ